MLTSVAPASTALSMSSRTTETGSSTTSPAAICCATSGASTRMGRISVVDGASMLLERGKVVEGLERCRGGEIDFQKSSVHLAGRAIQRLPHQGRRAADNTGAFEIPQHCLGAVSHRFGQAGQPGHLDAVTAVGRA